MTLRQLWLLLASGVLVVVELHLEFSKNGSLENIQAFSTPDKTRPPAVSQRNNLFLANPQPTRTSGSSVDAWEGWQGEISFVKYYVGLIFEFWQQPAAARHEYTFRQNRHALVQAFERAVMNWCLLLPWGRRLRSTTNNEEWHCAARRGSWDLDEFRSTGPCQIWKGVKELFVGGFGCDVCDQGKKNFDDDIPWVMN